MKRADLVDHVTDQTGMSQESAKKAVHAVLRGIRKGLRDDGIVTLAGFGVFSVAQRAARVGRNPRTGQAVHIPAARVPKFKPGKHLKDVVN